MPVARKSSFVLAVIYLSKNPVANTLVILDMLAWISDDLWKTYLSGSRILPSFAVTILIYSWYAKEPKFCPCVHRQNLAHILVAWKPAATGMSFPNFCIQNLPRLS